MWLTVELIGTGITNLTLVSAQAVFSLKSSAVCVCVCVRVYSGEAESDLVHFAVQQSDSCVVSAS